MIQDLPNVAAPANALTEAEARLVGASANRIVNLRGLLKSNKGLGSLTIQTSSGAVSLALTCEDITACLSVLMDREACLLTGFNVVLECTPA